MNKTELMRRYTTFFAALFFSAAGVSLITRSILGTSPISSIPYVLSINTPLSMGSYIFVLNMALIIIQLLLLGKEGILKNKIDLAMQIPVSVVFGAFIDFTMALFSFYHPDLLLLKIGTLITGCAILAFGICLEVIADVTMVSGEYTVHVASQRWGYAFGNVKIAFDVALVLLAVICSWSFSGTIAGIGLGTIITAIVTGPFVKLFLPHLTFIGKWQSVNSAIDRIE